ncbi:uncharacterized protein N7458_011103 [Penicillium daleae]|uniref:Uncharacterized protein n=1 Tax=Penicillium daleae TaxID=63821 RepID=A0AAD6C0M9_9EURO|nr:uncharacterized protein N7458_011103 [Penicillium daleae]KAJ5440105.1 hypothetical protein N7458_011103 [Penicillium daleae]
MYSFACNLHLDRCGGSTVGQETLGSLLRPFTGVLETLLAGRTPDLERQTDDHGAELDSLEALEALDAIDLPPSAVPLPPSSSSSSSVEPADDAVPTPLPSSSSLPAPPAAAVLPVPPPSVAAPSFSRPLPRRSSRIRSPTQFYGY